MAGVNVIVDTGPLVGFIDGSDQWHDWARGQFARLPGPMLTCEAVISEAAYLLGGGPAADALLEMVELGALTLAPLLPEEITRVRALMGRYGARMQFADACLVRLSELRPQSRVLTTDKADFSVYRRNRNERIPLFAP